LNKAGATLTSDFIQGVSFLTFGGTLRLVLTGDPLAVGDTFTLYAAGLKNGAFDFIEPVTPGPGLAWDTTSLLTNGTLRVAVAPRPVIASFALVDGVPSGGSTISGTNGIPRVLYYVLASTNLSLPIPAWTRLGTNFFDNSGSFQFTNPSELSSAQRFYILQIP
jgi:hypothetical protein